MQRSKGGAAIADIDVGDGVLLLIIIYPSTGVNTEHRNFGDQ